MKWAKSTNFRLTKYKLPDPKYMRPKGFKHTMSISDLPQDDQPAPKYRKPDDDEPRTKSVGRIRVLRHS